VGRLRVGQAIGKEEKLASCEKLRKLRPELAHSPIHKRGAQIDTALRRLFAAWMCYSQCRTPLTHRWAVVGPTSDLIDMSQTCDTGEQSRARFKEVELGKQRQK